MRFKIGNDCWLLSAGLLAAGCLLYGMDYTDGAQHPLYTGRENPNALSVGLGGWGRGLFYFAFFGPILIGA